MKEFIEEILYKGSSAANVRLTGKEVALFKLYLTELKKWNSKINITAIRNDSQILIKHFIDSLFPLKYIPGDIAILDIGSGGGFPGIPLKIANPSLSVTLLDANRKKVNFQKHIIRTLNLDKIKAVHGRAEDKDTQKKMGAAFHVVISRAFSALGIFLAMGEPYLQDQGILIAMRGKETQRDLADNAHLLIRLRLQLADVFEFRLPYLNEKRSILVFNSTKCPTAPPTMQ